jgi:hypothetical protein
MSELKNDIANLRKLLTGETQRAVILTVHQQITKRIFDDGKDKNETLIGNYTLGYLKRRVKKGFPSNRKVILEFTGQMRNDFLVVDVNGQLGSGFLNKFNADKSFWVEETYAKEIFDISKSETDLLIELLDQSTTEIL